MNSNAGRDWTAALPVCIPPDVFVNIESSTIPSGGWEPKAIDVTKCHTKRAVDMGGSPRPKEALAVTRVPTKQKTAKQ